MILKSNGNSKGIESCISFLLSLTFKFNSQFLIAGYGKKIGFQRLTRTILFPPWIALEMRQSLHSDSNVSEDTVSSCIFSRTPSLAKEVLGIPRQPLIANLFPYIST